MRVARNLQNDHRDTEGTEGGEAGTEQEVESGRGSAELQRRRLKKVAARMRRRRKKRAGWRRTTDGTEGTDGGRDGNGVEIGGIREIRGPHSGLQLFAGCGVFRA